MSRTMRVHTYQNGDVVATVYQDGMAVMIIEDTHPNSLGCKLINSLLEQADHTGGEGAWSDYVFPLSVVVS